MRRRKKTTEIIAVDIDKPSKSVLKEVAISLKEGAIIVYPTETCYGLGCSVFREKSVEKIFKLKRRPMSKKLPTIVDSLKTAKDYGVITKTCEKLVRFFMPGPLTLIVRKRKNSFPDIVNEDFAFRISFSKIPTLLSKYSSSPLISTSANIHGRSEVYSSEEAKRLFLGKVDIILDAGNLPKRPPSTIVDMRKGYPKLVREGAIPFYLVAKFFRLVRSR